MFEISTVEISSIPVNYSEREMNQIVSMVLAEPRMFEVLSEFIQKPFFRSFGDLGVKITPSPDLAVAVLARYNAVVRNGIGDEKDSGVGSAGLAEKARG